MLTATTLAIRLFGIPRFTYEQPLAGALSAKTLALLAYILLHRESRVARETAAFSLWPDETEENALANLRRALYLLQRWLPAGPQWISADRRSIAWNRESPYWLDVEEYDHLVSAGAQADAAKLYDGDLLQSLDDEWIEERRAYYRNAQLGLLTSCIAQLREGGDVESGIALARRGLQIDPWHEEFIREIMLLRALTGDRAGALAEYRTFEQAIRKEMNAAPSSETAALYERVRGGAVGEKKQPRRIQNLPAPISSFIGRAEEIACVRELMTANRLVTLVGSGGVGKTRLALRVAADCAQAYPDGTWFVDVTPLEDTPALLQTVAQTLRLHTVEGNDLLDRIVDELRERHVLLVLDNCERAIEACAAFAGQVLLRCPNVSIMATSRARFRLAGEAMYDVAPLSQSDAAALFVERAAAAGAGFQLTHENAAAVSAACDRLDGIPLAIELAAGRLRLLSIDQILERLDDRFTLLRSAVRNAAPHQQTLRATIDWSYALLEEEERAVLDRLAVFSGTCSVQSIAAVCAAPSPEQTLDALEQLAEKSLVMVVRRREENRYRLLDSVREYLVEKLREREGLNDTRARHLAYFVHFAEDLEPQLTRAGQEIAMARLTDERDNLRAAFTWPAADREHLGMRLRLASALRWFYWFRGMFDLARQRLAESIQAYGFERSAVYSRALATYGFFVLQQGDTSGAIEALERALEACPQDGPERERAMLELQSGSRTFSRATTPRDACS